MLRDGVRPAGQVLIDAVGKLPFSRCSSALTQRGAYLPSDHLRNLALVAWTSRRPGKHVLFPIPPQYAKKDAEFIRGLFEAGKYRAVIDRCYTLDQVVEATRYVASAEKTGNVVLIVGSEAQ
ncbi:MAG: zinc-binding dehydrogenase [Chloroflexi bacterium]|nr:MAG: zinc-binding dehydrogenase [Chloroflexota bacterium]